MYLSFSSFPAIGRGVYRCKRKHCKNTKPWWLRCGRNILLTHKFNPLLEFGSRYRPRSSDKADTCSIGTFLANERYPVAFFCNSDGMFESVVRNCCFDGIKTVRFKSGKEFIHQFFEWLCQK